MDIFLYILFKNILPIVFLILVGFLLGKKFQLDIQTLSKLNFYVYVPVFIFVQILTTDIPSGILRFFLFVVLLGVLNTLASEFIARIRKYDVGLKSAFINSITFYNSGNIGVSLITLVFSTGPFLVNGQTPYLTLALTTQIVVLVVQNITMNTIGFMNAGRGNMDWKSSVKEIFKMPSIYIIPFAFILKLLPYNPQNFPLWPAFEYIKGGLISISLITLGVQLSKTKVSIKDKEVFISNFTRLIGGPIFGVVIAKSLNITGVSAQVLVICAAIPTAVTTALIAVEKDNYPDFASQAVVSATLLSTVTLTFVIYISRFIFPVV